MKVIWAILCERAVIDRETNNLSLFNVIEEVTIPVQPPVQLAELSLPSGVLPSLFEIVILWARSDVEFPEKGQGRIRLIVPDDKEVLTQEIEVDLTQFLRLRTRVHLPGLPAGSEGQYLFKVDAKSANSNWNEMFELPLRVVIQTQDSG